MDEPKYKLPEETARQFKWAPGAPPVFEHLHYGKIDIRTVTPERAQQLIDAGCEHVVVKKATQTGPGNSNE